MAPVKDPGLYPGERQALAVTGLKPGSIRNKNGQFSIWRVPNFLLEPRGDYFHEPDELIDRLSRFRSIAGWIAGIIVTISAAILVIPVVALILVLAADRGYRRVTAYQLRWVVIAAASFAGLSAVTLGVSAAVGYLEKSLTRHSNTAVSVVASLLAIPIAVVLFAWFFKGLYLIATGLFRADDAHPLLAPVAGIPIVWIVASQTRRCRPGQILMRAHESSAAIAWSASQRSARS